MFFFFNCSSKVSFLPQSRPFSYWSFVKLETHGKFQMEHIKKCLDTMAITGNTTQHNSRDRQMDLYAVSFVQEN